MEESSHAPTFCWRTDAVTAEELPGGRSWLMRFHVGLGEGRAPKTVANCVVAGIDEFEAEIKGWGGLRGPTTRDARALALFCISKGFTEAYWWRHKDGRSKQVWLYQRIAY